MHALDATRCRKRDLHPRKAGDEDAAYRGYLLQLGQSLHLLLQAWSPEFSGRRLKEKDAPSVRSHFLHAHIGRLFQLHTLVRCPSVHWAIPRVLAALEDTCFRSCRTGSCLIQSPAILFFPLNEERHTVSPLVSRPARDRDHLVRWNPSCSCCGDSATSLAGPIRLATTGRLAGTGSLASFCAHSGCFTHLLGWGRRRWRVARLSPLGRRG
mmetsp:Transcript_137916/g.326783  ORF Transcript_137916/g.326783 Transcript_137916/m.326783 type:complete len:211 (-) Transcript_137916:401-1033(-)